MEIERKFLIQKLEELPFSPFDYPHKELEQGYLCTAPVVRIRREDDDYILTASFIKHATSFPRIVSVLKMQLSVPLRFFSN